MSQDQVSLFDRTDLELRGHPTFKSTRFQSSPIGVITGIEGGSKRPFEKVEKYHGVGDDRSGSEGEEREERRVPGGILTTVRIEQSYV